MKVGAKFYKNYFIMDYHSEEFTQEVEEEFNIRNTYDYNLASILLGGLAERSVLLSMLQKEYITAEFFEERIKKIKSLVSYLYNSSKEKASIYDMDAKLKLMVESFIS